MHLQIRRRISRLGALRERGKTARRQTLLVSDLHYDLRKFDWVLAEAAAQRTGKWLWAHHGSAEGPPSWRGSRHYGDSGPPRLIGHHRPDIVLCGHIHQAHWVPGGGWDERRGDTWFSIDEAQVPSFT